jgi:hypothetical protein
MRDSWYVRLARFGSSGVWRTLVRLAALMLCCVLGPRVSAQPAERTVALRLDADRDCVAIGELRSRIAAPTWHVVEVSAPGAELVLSASVLRQPDGLLVRLQVRWPDGRDAERSVAAQSCEASLDALALLVQMTLDAAERAPEQAARDVDEYEPWHRVSSIAAGASFGLGTGAAPELQPGLGVFVALGLRGVGVIRPWLQIELAHAWSNGHALSAGRADFALDGGQVLLCPIAWSHALFAAHGCGAFELSRLRARGYDTFEPRSQTRVWASAGAGLLVRVPVWKLDLQVGGALLHPLSRDQFSFAPDVFFAVPAWRWQLKVGVGVRFM